MKRIIHNPALKETIIFRKLSAETAGAYSELEISLAPGGGNPMHYHRSYSELFTAIEGEMGLELKGGKRMLLQPGESFLVEKGVNHRFFNPGNDTISFTNRVEPGSTGLEDTLRILCGLAADGLYNGKNIPKNIFHMAVCADMSDMRLTGVITSPIVYLFAEWAKRKGVRDALVGRYCV